MIRLLRMVFILGGLLTLLIALAVMIPRRGVKIPPSAWIVFGSYRSDQEGIYRVHISGRAEQLIAQVPPENGFPSWSPDGHWIMFGAWPDDRTLQIYKVRPDGRDLQRLSNFHSNRGVWSPDGEWIAFVGYRLGSDGIYRMRADGSQAQRVIASPLLMPYSRPVWSPDGQWIAFVSYRDGENPHIYRVRANGHDEQLLSGSSFADTDPFWSPDGQWILFLSLRDDQWGFYRVRPDGSDLQKLNDFSFPAQLTEKFVEKFVLDDLKPAWSPDGKWVALVLAWNGDWDIYRMRADGSNFHQLTTNPGSHFYPAWSPDGQWIAFQGYQKSNLGIYRMRADGSDLQRLADHTSLAGGPVWSPPVNVPFRPAIPLLVGAVLIAAGVVPWGRFRR